MFVFQELGFKVHIKKFEEIRKLETLVEETQRPIAHYRRLSQKPIEIRELVWADDNGCLVAEGVSCSYEIRYIDGRRDRVKVSYSEHPGMWEEEFPDMGKAKSWCEEQNQKEFQVIYNKWAIKEGD